MINVEWDLGIWDPIEAAETISTWHRRLCLAAADLCRAIVMARQRCQLEPSDGFCEWSNTTDEHLTQLFVIWCQDTWTDSFIVWRSYTVLMFFLWDLWKHSEARGVSRELVEDIIGQVECNPSSDRVSHC
jgi:hypothetical protein